MSTILHRIPIETLYAPSSLFGDFASHPNGAVAATLGWFGAGSTPWESRLRSPALSRDDDTRRYFSTLADANRSIGVKDEIVERLSRIPTGEARVVITGQQPGVLGGPLMSLYKIETAVALARRLEREHGTPFIPVYWMGADDADFAEIRELIALSGDHQVLATSLPSGAHEVGMPVGDIDATWLRRLWDGVDAFVGGFEGGDAVVAAVSRALEQGNDQGSVSARVVAALTGGGVAIVDSREPWLRRAARGVILDFFDREAEIKQQVEAGGRTLEDAGFHAQLSLGPDSGVFVLEDGRRTKVPDERRAEARARIEADPGVASPGVVLRNLVQDAVFDPVAVVLGPAEIAYRAQVKGAYDLLGVPLPVSFPRLFATFVPPAVAAIVSDGGEEFERLVTAPGEFVKQVFLSQTDPRLERARADFEAAFAAQVQEFLSAAASAMDDASLGKMRKRLGEVERRLSGAVAAVNDAGRARALERWPFLEGLPDVFARKGAAQERYLSMLVPFLFGGCTSDECVRAAAVSHVDAALDGRIEHVVYSG